MALQIQYHPLARGETVWHVAGAYASRLPYKDQVSNMNVLLEWNNLTEVQAERLPVGYRIRLTDPGKTGDAAVKEEMTNIVAGKPTISSIGLLADPTKANGNPGKEVVVFWKTYNTNTKNYEYEWGEMLAGRWVHKSSGSTEGGDSSHCYSTCTASQQATQVRFRVRAIAKEGTEEKNGLWETIKDMFNGGEGNSKEAVGSKWSDWKSYNFANNPPLPPPVPKVKIENTRLTTYIDNVDPDEIDANAVVFEIVKDNKTKVNTSVRCAIELNYASYACDVTNGSIYKVRAKASKSKDKESAWSDFSENVGTKPAAPERITSCKRVRRSDGTFAAYLAWTKVQNATSYIIEYVTNRDDFDSLNTTIKSVSTADTDNPQRTSVEISGIESGHNYFFRVRAVRDDSGTSLSSDPSPINSVAVGEAPAAPSTRSSADSAFVGESMELSWTHNARDGSSQTSAQIGLKIDDNDWFTQEFPNNTSEFSDSDETDVIAFKYGKVISYKGEMHVELNTSHPDLKNAKVWWKVRTAGILEGIDNSDWSMERIIYIYEKPNLTLSMVKDVEDDDASIIETLDSFPFYIHAKPVLESNKYQSPVGYHLQIVTDTFYETIDDSGRTQVINAGDAIYSKYFDTSDDLIVEISANDVDLQPLVRYKIYCTVDMSTGLTAEADYEFDVYWSDETYSLDADVQIDYDSYTAAISPRCTDDNGNLVDDVELSVYRREYDGSLKEIASQLPNNGVTVTDPHPSLDYARYRIIAKDMTTGSISFYDRPGEIVGGKSIMIQWDEAWESFEVVDEYLIDSPTWAGSLLQLPYNVDVVDNRKRDVTFIGYAGREHPVSYYGTLMSESPSWSVSIPADDKETIYALRRLSLWSGDVYIREPSGMGYWANVTVSFNQTHNELTIPVSLSITRVEGGI